MTRQGVVRRVVAAAATVLLVSGIPGLTQGSAAAVTLTPRSVTMLAVGDLMCHTGQLSAARSAGRYSFAPSFSAVAPIIKSADLAVGNLETTLRGSGFSGYPRFRTPTSYADALKDAGFDVLTTANNHALDGGASGVRYTTKYLDGLGIPNAGTNGRRWTIVTVKGVRIALLPYTYATNGISSPFAGAVSRIDYRAIQRDIASARKVAEFVVVYLHWGTEYSMTPEETSRRLAHNLIDSGADLILGSHPHVIRPVESYHGHYIVHSMGNFLSGQVRQYTDLGIMVRITIVRSGSGVRATGVEVMPVYRDRSPGRGTSTYRTVAIDRELSEPDRLISGADAGAMRSYRALCARMFGSYYPGSTR